MKDVKYVLVWGTSARHYPQHCGLGHNLHDEDVVQIVKKKVNLFLCLVVQLKVNMHNKLHGCYIIILYYYYHNQTFIGYLKSEESHFRSFDHSKFQIFS